MTTHAPAPSHARGDRRTAQGRRGAGAADGARPPCGRRCLRRRHAHLATRARRGRRPCLAHRDTSPWQDPPLGRRFSVPDVLAISRAPARRRPAAGLTGCPRSLAPRQISLSPSGGAGDAPRQGPSAPGPRQPKEEPTPCPTPVRTVLASAWRCPRMPSQRIPPPGATNGGRDGTWGRFRSTGGRASRISFASRSCHPSHETSM